MSGNKFFLGLHMILLFQICGIPLKVVAKDFGSVGNSFEIKEESFLEMIQRKLAKLDLRQEQEKMTQKATESAKEPKAVLSIKRASKNRNFIFDPTEILKKDIKYPNGKVMHKAGTKINPLDSISFDKELYFIDGSDRAQVKWLKSRLNQVKKKEKKIILVKGRIFDLEEEFGRKIYFDQFGYMSKKIGIKAVPAFAYQEANERVIRVIEYKI